MLNPFTSPSPMTKATAQHTKVPTLRFPGFLGEWEEKKLGDFAPLQRWFDLPTTDVQKWKYPVAYSNWILRHHNAFKTEWPGVFTGRSWTIWNVFYIEDNYWPHNTSLWVTDFKNNYPKFVYFFYSQFGLEKFGTGSWVPTLNRNDVHNQKRSFPTLPEQKKIADFLSCIDDKITSLSSLKSARESYKTGIMQQIFSQKIRFRDENGKAFGEREEKKLGEICEIATGKSKSEYNISEGKNIIVDMGAIWANGNLIWTKKTNHSGDMLEYWDLVMAKDDIGWWNIIGKVVLIDQNNKYILWDHVYKLQCNNWIIKYIYYAVNSYKVNKQFRIKANGTAQIWITNWTVKNQIISFPSLPEQIKIANFLSQIDEKIDKVSQQIEKAKEWKKGLLQGLFI